MLSSEPNYHLRSSSSKGTELMNELYRHSSIDPVYRLFETARASVEL
jgi:hypothetical protein